MKITTTKKPLLQRLFKTKYSTKTPTTKDIKEVAQQQNCSVKNIKEIVNDVKSKQPRTTVGTHDFVSSSKHLKHMEKNRHKMTTPYIRPQSSDPMSPNLKAVQMVTQNMDTLSPKTKKLTQITRSKHDTDFDIQLPPVSQNPPGDPDLAKQIQSLSRLVEQLQQLQSQKRSSRHSRLRKLQTRTCFRCHKRGHLAKDCRKHWRRNHN